MNFINSLANLMATGGDAAGEIVDSAWQSYISVVNVVMPVLIAMVVSFGLVYGIIIGVQFAKAEETDDRNKAKERLVNLVIGVVVAAVIISVVYVILGSNWIHDLISGRKINNPSGNNFLALFR